MTNRSFFHRNSGIDWYVEQRGSGPHVVLIPSGEGDCAAFEKVAANLATDFTVTTFDTPGFSRTKADDGIETVIPTLGDQVAALIQSLGIASATFYGCSSGGVAALDIASRHGGLVHRAIVHEAALDDPNRATSPLQALLSMDDETASATCAQLFANVFNEDPAAWEALGGDYHARLAKNYVTWVRNYLAKRQRKPFAPSELAGRPITWTIGALFEVAVCFSNVRLAHRAGIAIDILPCKHFPHVTIPDVLAQHIRANAKN